MINLFYDQPLLLQWMPLLDQGLVLGINRIGQICIVTGTFMFIFVDKLQPLISRSLIALANFIRVVVAEAGLYWDREGYGFVWPREKPLSKEKADEEFQIGRKFLVSLVFLGILISISGRGPLGWLLFPFEVLLRAFTVWFEVQFSLWSIIVTLGSSIGRLFGSFLLLILSIFACAIVVRPFAYVLSRIADYISQGLYRLVASIVFIIGSFLVFITTR